jgi:uncharacterized membrane protein YdcZ (DUF606 family)
MRVARAAVLGAVLAAAALAAPRVARAQPDAPAAAPAGPLPQGPEVTGPPGEKYTWSISVGQPVNSDNDDGQHIELAFKRLYTHAAGNKILIFHRPLGDGEVVHHGLGPVNINHLPAFGREFLAGRLSLKDQLARTPNLPDQPLPLEGLKLEAGKSRVGPWTLAGIAEQDGSFVDQVDPGVHYVYALVPATPGAETGTFTNFPELGAQTDGFVAQASFFNVKRWFYLAFIVMTAVVFFFYVQRAKTRARSMFIRRIPGVDAIEDAIGRSTEMGRPVLYVTGTEEITDIQTMASLLILGYVAEMTAEYDTEIKVANLYPLTMIVAEEIVRQGYSNAGRIDAHKPENVMFITSEQFAYAAAINGMILRDKPATNIFLGRFFAESLLLSETGFVVGAVQIAGTAEFTQLPFFIAACDYTLIGEELYAVSAYLTREPNLIAQLKAGDVMKVVIMGLLIVGVILSTLGIFDLGSFLVPAQ